MTIHWTPDRPTKPGKYWLSVHPDKRPGEQRPDVVFPAITTFILYGGGQGSYREGGSMLDIADPWFDGAQWLPYVEPPDPFAEPVPSLRERVEALPTYGYHGGLDEIARRRGGEYLKRSEVLALFEVPQ